MDRETTMEEFNFPDGSTPARYSVPTVRLTRSTDCVLVVDDDADTRANLVDILALDGFEVETASSIAEALAREDWSRYCAVLLDRWLPEGGAENLLLPRLRQLAPDVAVLIITGHSDLQGAIAALRQGASDYILKPINPDALRASLARIAERRQLTHDKRRSDAAFRTLVDAAPCMIVILRPDHTIAYFSGNACELVGLTAGEVLGRDFLELFALPEQRGSLAEPFRVVLEGTPVRNIEHPIRCRAGGAASQRVMLWNARRLDDHEGAPAILLVGQDITGLKQAQERTLQAERLAAIGQMVTGLAHESGNALARSQACLEMLRLEVEDRPEALDLLGRIQKAQDHLQHLYEEVRGYAAPLLLQREESDLREVWRQAWTHLAMARQDRAVSLREECPESDRLLRIDPFRLEQVFRNIFENALAACRDPVEIVVRCHDTTRGGQPAVCLAVCDNGPGLSPEAAERLFDPFFTTKTKGTGLGMAIVKRIVAAHGGTVTVAGEPGGGAEILITLPRESP
jgi:two-component system sensor kinase FixL